MLHDRTAIPKVSWTLIMLTITPETMLILEDHNLLIDIFNNDGSVAFLEMLGMMKRGSEQFSTERAGKHFDVAVTACVFIYSETVAPNAKEASQKRVCGTIESQLDIVMNNKSRNGRIQSQRGNSETTLWNN